MYILPPLTDGATKISLFRFVSRTPYVILITARFFSGKLATISM